MRLFTRRRALLLFPVAAASCSRPAPVVEHAEGNEVTIAEFDDSGTSLGMKKRPKVVRPDGEWWSKLTPQQYYVLRRKSTDTPFTGTYYRIQEPTGLYRCAGCDNALFLGADQYHSGTGWPSFQKPIAKENIRIEAFDGVPLSSGHEVLCRLCDGHLGHVFDDGPPPEGLRYCINESSLRRVVS